MNRSRIYRAIAELFLVLFILILIFSLARIISVRSLIGDVYDALDSSEKARFWIRSFLFDLKTSTIILAPALLGCILCFYDKFNKIFEKVSFIFYIIAIVLALSLSIGNHYYYKTYGHTFDLLVFGAAKEDLGAVLISIWEGYPVIIGTITSIIIVALLVLVIKFSHRILSKFIKDRCRSVPILVFFVLVLIAGWVVAIRGSLGSFPLRKTDVAITSQSKVNGLVANGLISFFWNTKNYFSSGKLKPVTQERLQQLLSYFNLKPSSLDDPFIYLKRTTPANDYLKVSRPSVVLALMESMSQDMLLCDNETEFDVLGSLRESIHRSDIYVFKNFVSEGDGTIDSLQRLLVNTGDYMDLSVGVYNKKNFVSSTVNVYKNAGYKTILITSGLTSWRNIGDFAVTQGFDVVIDQNEILKRNPNAQLSTWGVYDEYLFDVAKTILLKEEQPVFIFMLSVTNHPPYQVPEGSYSMPRNNSCVDSKYKNSDIYDMYDTYHYANNELGKFINNIANDQNIGTSTIIAFTGDHNVRGLNVYNRNQDQIMGHQVPFGLYIPNNIRNSIEDFSFDSTRFASHKDVMPTLFGLSLDNEYFYHTGCDLIHAQLSCPFDFAYNEMITVSLTDNSVCIKDNSGESVSKAFKLLSNKFIGTDTPSDNSKICDVAKHYRELLQWYLSYQTVGLTNK